MINKWLDEIKDAKKREKEFRKKGKMILDVYSGEKSCPFNILYSNTETLLPALFSNIPRPIVQRRFKDDDPLGKAVANAAQRMLEYLLDLDVEKYDKFSDAMEMATLSSLLPGRGVTAIRYDAEIEEENEQPINKIWETVCTDDIKWDRVYFGYATKWTHVPWIAYENYFDETEAKELFKNKVKYLQFTEGEEEEQEDEIKSHEEDSHQGKRKTALVYQIWDKEDKKVKYVAPQYKDDYLRVDDDPLELENFFNCPKPLQFVAKPADLIPVALYALYENQAKELNKIQTRLNRVIDAIKVRGVYDGSLGSEIENILKEEDNALLPTDKAATLAAEGGLDKAIWFLPLTELIGVAQQLYQARESAKRVIYEITGISDIVRGQSLASETLGAQKIKESWGTMRLKRLQKEVQRYVLDTMKIMLEIAASKFSVNTWKTVTMLPFPTAQEKQQAQQQLQAIQQQAQQQAIMAQQQAMQTGQPPQPPQPPDPKLMQMAQSFTWEDILTILKDDFARSYRLDIETNSTLDIEATEDKQNVSEFMNAVAQFMNGVAPMIQNGTLPFAAAQTMLLAVVRRFRFGSEVEDQLKAMKPPQPPQDPKMQQAQQQLQQAQQKFAQDQQTAQKQLQDKKQQLDTQQAQLDFEKRLAQMELKNQQRLAELEIRHKQEISQAQDEIRKSKITSDLEVTLANHQKKMQQFFDKQMHRLERANVSTEMQ